MLFGLMESLKAQGTRDGVEESGASSKRLGVKRT
jgi:hypothetical protein